MTASRAWSLATLTAGVSEVVSDLLAHGGVTGTKFAHDIKSPVIQLTGFRLTVEPRQARCLAENRAYAMRMHLSVERHNPGL